MIKKNTIVFSLIFCFSYLAFSAVDIQSATISTKNGKHEGRVIARMFDQIVITVVTSEMRIFQFTAADVEMISATDVVLVSVNTFLREEPSNTAETSTPLTRGQEVTILESPDNSEWVKVEIWGKQEGWMIRDLLVNKIVYTPEEKNIDGAFQKSNSNRIKSNSNQEP